MKILITGASGNLGKLTRHLFADHDVHLFSRKKIEANKNEHWIPSEDLSKYEWWSNFEFLEFYDIIFHYAEPVKSKISTETKKFITISHLHFLSNATQNSTTIIYPMTAYKHDDKTICPHNDYLDIKEDILEKLSVANNIKFPVFHPLIDYGPGLSKIIIFSRKIPFFNIFFSFQATLPILYKSDLEKYIVSAMNSREKHPEIYSKILSVSSIFHDKNKINSALLSRITLLIMQTLNKPKFHLLLNGRKIYP